MYLILQLNQCDSTAWSGYSFGLSIISYSRTNKKSSKESDPSAGDRVCSIKPSHLPHHEGQS